jgi:AcrR family transcriptional regulator
VEPVKVRAAGTLRLAVHRPGTHMSSTDQAKDARHRRSLLRQDRSRQTRENIVRAAARLWNDKGYEQTSVAEICDAAGVGRTTYYFHFESKEQLLGELTWLTASGVAHSLDNADPDADVDQRVALFMAELSRRVEAMPRHLAARVLTAAMPGVARLGQFPEGRVDFGRTLARIFASASQRGEIDPTVDTDELGAILGGMVMEAMLRWATGHTGDRALTQLLEHRATLVLDGLRTLPP